MMNFVKYLLVFLMDLCACFYVWDFVNLDIVGRRSCSAWQLKTLDNSTVMSKGEPLSTYISTIILPNIGCGKENHDWSIFSFVITNPSIRNSMEQNISFPLLQASQPMQPCHQPEEKG
jgi:hypothetical protein